MLVLIFEASMISIVTPATPAVRNREAFIQKLKAYIMSQKYLVSYKTKKYMHAATPRLAFLMDEV
jgi:spore coat protein CotF